MKLAPRVRSTPYWQLHKIPRLLFGQRLPRVTVDLLRLVDLGWAYEKTKPLGGIRLFDWLLKYSII